MIKKHTKISLLWVSMVCGSFFGAESSGIRRKSPSETFQGYIRSYSFIPHTKREAGFLAAGTVGMGYLWALRSESVKCMLVAPPAVYASHLALSKLGLLGLEKPITTKREGNIPTVASLTRNNQGSKPFSEPEQSQEVVGLENNTRIPLPEERIEEQVSELSGQIARTQQGLNQDFDNINKTTSSVHADLEELKKVCGSKHNTDVARISWWPFGKKS